MVLKSKKIIFNLLEWNLKCGKSKYNCERMTYLKSKKKKNYKKLFSYNV